jgi:uncharacterized membrane protein (UPF0127 family)
MKFIDILFENNQITFQKKCEITIINDFGESVIIDCEVPSTEEEKSTGLMYRDNLCDNCGLFYDYVDSGFWMKNVNFPIEMIFVNGNEIVDIVIAHANDETIIHPSKPSNGNIEVNKGFCENNDISVGNTFYIS